MSQATVDAQKISDELKRQYRNALDVQNASNLSGVLIAWHKASCAVREAVGGNVSDSFLHHPINVLFMSKVASLMKVNADSFGSVGWTREETLESGAKRVSQVDGFYLAWEACRKGAED